VIASKGGAPQRPGWSCNILANPEIEMQVGTREDEGAGEDRRR
jgi:F420H(2)-dependent quinone reductase